MSRYVVRVYRLGKGKRREKDSVMIMEGEWDANVDMADDIGEYAGNSIAESIACDVAMLQEQKQADAKLPTIKKMSGLIE
jgi:hypothetical protein